MCDLPRKSLCVCVCARASAFVWVLSTAKTYELPLALVALLITSSGLGINDF